MFAGVRELPPLLWRGQGVTASPQLGGILLLCVAILTTFSMGSSDVGRRERHISPDEPAHLELGRASNATSVPQTPSSKTGPSRTSRRIERGVIGRSC